MKNECGVEGSETGKKWVQVSVTTLNYYLIVACTCVQYWANYQ